MTEDEMRLIKKDVNELLDKWQKEEEEEKRKRSEPQIVGTCIVCKGLLIEKKISEFDSTTGPLIIGPGSAGQFNTYVDGCYCQVCGLRYEFPPKVKSDQDE